MGATIVRRASRRCSFRISHFQRFLTRRFSPGGRVKFQWGLSILRVSATTHGDKPQFNFAPIQKGQKIFLYFLLEIPIWNPKIWMDFLSIRIHWGNRIDYCKIQSFRCLEKFRKYSWIIFFMVPCFMSAISIINSTNRSILWTSFLEAEKNFNKWFQSISICSISHHDTNFQIKTILSQISYLL